MDTCTVETGFLRKKPCGHRAVSHYATCERPLCAPHAVAQVTATHQKTGKYMCKDCDTARQDYDKSQARLAKHQEENRLAQIMNNPASPPSPQSKTAAPGAEPGAQHQDAPATPAQSDSAPLEFTPSDKKK